jgi:hypothetical protein
MANHSTKRDANQAEIVAALFAAGCSVQDLHAVGGGCPDLLVGRLADGGFRRCYLLEIKMPKNKAGEPKPLTPDQVNWHWMWRGQAAIVTTPEEALRAVGLLP